MTELREEIKNREREKERKKMGREREGESRESQNRGSTERWIEKKREWRENGERIETQQKLNIQVK